MAMVAERRFVLGRCIATQGAIARLARTTIDAYLARHAAGDWGLSVEDDAALNEQAIDDAEGRVLSCYEEGGVRVYVITEDLSQGDEVVTTIMLAEEY